MKSLSFPKGGQWWHKICKFCRQICNFRRCSNDVRSFRASCRKSRKRDLSRGSCQYRLHKLVERSITVDGKPCACRLHRFGGQKRGNFVNKKSNREHQHLIISIHQHVGSASHLTRALREMPQVQQIGEETSIYFWIRPIRFRRARVKIEMIQFRMGHANREVRDFFCANLCAGQGRLVVTHFFEISLEHCQYSK